MTRPLFNDAMVETLVKNRLDAGLSRDDAEAEVRASIAEIEADEIFMNAIRGPKSWAEPDTDTNTA